MRNTGMVRSMSAVAQTASARQILLSLLLVLALLQSALMLVGCGGGGGNSGDDGGASGNSGNSGDDGASGDGGGGSQAATSQTFTLDGVELTIGDASTLGELDAYLDTYIGNTRMGSSRAWPGSTLGADTLTASTDYQEYLVVLIEVDGELTDVEAVATAATLSADGEDLPCVLAWATDGYLVLLFDADPDSQVAFAGTEGSTITLIAE